jgi:hypothetical protein
MDELWNRLMAYTAEHDQYLEDMPVGLQISVGGLGVKMRVLYSLSTGRAYLDANDALREIHDWLEVHA